MGFAPPAAHVTMPSFFTVTGRTARPPGSIVGTPPSVKFAAIPFVTVYGMSLVATPCPENQVTPSSTRSRRKRYVPAVAGGTSGSATTAVAPGATSCANEPRAPFQTTTVRSGASQ